jgi:exodeoxyribonuclease VII small subunit
MSRTPRCPRCSQFNALALDGPFEEVFEALEAVVEHLERGRLSLDESIAWYEAGLGLTRRCSELLQQAELRIRTLDVDNLSRPEETESPWTSNNSWHREGHVRSMET